VRLLFLSSTTGISVLSVLMVSALFGAGKVQAAVAELEELLEELEELLEGCPPPPMHFGQLNSSSGFSKFMGTQLLHMI